MDEFIKVEGYKVLYVLGIPYQAKKIIKHDNNISGLDEQGNRIWLFPNISNINDYILEQGQAWDIDEKIELQKQIDTLSLQILNLMGV